MKKLWMLCTVLVVMNLCTVTGLFAEIVYVDRPDSAGRFAPLIKNDRSAARVNSERMAVIMSAVSRGTTLFFLREITISMGRQRPITDLSNRVRRDRFPRGRCRNDPNPAMQYAKDFGFACREDLKRVPAATLRIRHKGCVVENLTIALDPELPSKSIAGTAALQIAHIAYYPDNNVGIVETTGQGEDFLIDHVTVSRVNIGENLGSGILATRFLR